MNIVSLIISKERILFLFVEWVFKYEKKETVKLTMTVSLVLLLEIIRCVLPK